MVDPVKQFLPEKYWNRQRFFFMYSLTWAALAASAAGQEADNGGFQVSTDADFLVLEITHTLTNAAGTTEEDYPPVSLLSMNVTGVNSNWFLGTTKLSNISGRMADTGHGPHKLPFPRLIGAGNKVTAVAQNLAATAWALQITFGGVWINRSIEAGVS